MRKRLLFSLTLLLAMFTAAKAEDMKTVPLTVESVNGGWVYFTNKAAGVVTYKVNGGEAKTIESKKTASINLKEGDLVSFWGDNAVYGSFYSNQSSMIDVEEDEVFYVYGNIMSLVNSTDFATTTTLTEPYAFANMFYESYVTSHPTKALVLPATTLSSYCYYNMFYRCDITSAPALPATTLAESCYNRMFYQCWKLETAPVLPATMLTKNCYQDMFNECSKLATAPTLSATSLAESCYNCMFYKCSSLTAAPSLPATTLAESCYDRMFEKCTKIQVAPTLPATTLTRRCYRYMFRETALTSAPALPATTMTESCYEGMFEDCKNLTTAPDLPALMLAKDCYSSMFNGCTNLSSVPELSATSLAERCYEGMFKYCETLTTAPALPAVTLAEDCYKYMFMLCTNLQKAPDLPAPKLVMGCYISMFEGCDQLNSLTCLATDIGVYNCTSQWLTGVSETGTFTQAPGISWERGWFCVPTEWEIEEVSSLALATVAIDLDNNEETNPYWTTFYNSVMSYEVEAGTKVYTASLSGTKLTFTEVTDRIIRAGQGVIIASDNAFITMTPTTAAGTESYYADNVLIGSDTKVPLESPFTYYALADLHNGLGFYKVNHDWVETIPAHKAFIKLSGAGARLLSIGHGDDATAIESVENNRKDEADEVYDMQGRRVQKPTHGFYIINGKKTIVK